MGEVQVLYFRPTDQQVGLRLDRALAALPEVGTRSQAEILIDAGKVLLLGKPCKASHKIRLEDEFVLYLENKTSEGIKPSDMKLDILFEDDALIVLNKPPGLVVHPGAGHQEDTLVNALVGHAASLSSGSNADRPGIVHRLDKETSGVLVVAKNDQVHEKLSQQFRERTTHRIYLALVVGKSLPREFQITSFLARHPTHRKKFASVRGNWTQEEPPPHGKWASTHGRVLKSASPQVHYVELKLETGRTHQIRVHLSESGCPIAGDDLYGADKKLSQVSSPKIREILRGLPRFALHASELGFTHPRTGERLSFRVNWPEDLFPMLKALEVL